MFDPANNCFVSTLISVSLPACEERLSRNLPGATEVRTIGNHEKNLPHPLQSKKAEPPSADTHRAVSKQSLAQQTKDFDIAKRYFWPALPPPPKSEVSGSVSFATQFEILKDRQHLQRPCKPKVSGPRAPTNNWPLEYSNSTHLA